MTTYLPRESLTSSAAKSTHASVKPGPLGRSTKGGADSRNGGMPSPVTSCCRLTEPWCGGNCDPVHGHRPSRVGRPRVERGLQIHVLEYGQRPRDHRPRLAVCSQEVADQSDDLVAVARLQPIGVHPLQKRAERGGERPRLLLGRTRHACTLTWES